MKTVIIVPLYNEEKYLHSFLKKLTSTTCPFVVVDDGSSDNSKAIALKYTQYVLTHKVNLGKGAAMTTGLRFAFDVLGAEAIVFMDGDDQHDVRDLPSFFAQLNRGLPIVLGVRKNMKTMPIIKKLANNVSSILVCALFGTYIPDIPSGFRAMTKEGYQKIAWQSSGYQAELEMILKIIKSHVKYQTVAITTKYHDSNKGFQFLDAVQMILQLIAWRLAL